MALIERRALLKGLFAMPAIVAASSLMPLRGVVMPLRGVVMPPQLVIQGWTEIKTLLVRVVAVQEHREGPIS